MSKVGTCRELTGILLAAEDRPTTAAEAELIVVHLAICEACVNFRAQVDFLRQVTRAWRARCHIGQPSSDA